MYLQITTKCNMTCAHCCYSCSMRGKHGDFNTIVDSIAFARDYDDYTISIGGGEPTLHPEFFDILKMCLQDFDYVWLATNGSQTESMFRLADIIDGTDYPECDCLEYMSEEEYDDYGCLCHKRDNIGIYQEDKLSVALSRDCFHDPIDQRVIDLWHRRSNYHRYNHFEIRNVQNSVIAQGRAKRTGSGWNKDNCVCSDIIIKPDGKLRLCGCTRSPIIGDVWDGIEDKWREVMQSDKFQDFNCWKGIK